MNNAYVVLDYPSGDQKKILLNGWRASRFCRSPFGEYPCRYAFAEGYKPSEEEVDYFNWITLSGGAPE